MKHIIGEDGSNKGYIIDYHEEITRMLEEDDKAKKTNNNYGQHEVAPATIGDYLFWFFNIAYIYLFIWPYVKSLYFYLRTFESEYIMGIEYVLRPIILFPFFMKLSFFCCHEIFEPLIRKAFNYLISSIKSKIKK